MDAEKVKIETFSCMAVSPAGERISNISVSVFQQANVFADRLLIVNYR